MGHAHAVRLLLPGAGALRERMRMLVSSAWLPLFAGVDLLLPQHAWQLSRSLKLTVRACAACGISLQGLRQEAGTVHSDSLRDRHAILGRRQRREGQGSYGQAGPSQAQGLQS